MFTTEEKARAFSSNMIKEKQMLYLAAVVLKKNEKQGVPETVLKFDCVLGESAKEATLAIWEAYKSGNPKTTITHSEVRIEIRPFQIGS
jgi:hypothetical protein